MLKTFYYALILLTSLQCYPKEINDIYENGKRQLYSYHLNDANNTLGEIRYIHPNASYLYTFTFSNGSIFNYSHQQLESLVISAKLGNLYALESLTQSSSLINKNRKQKLKILLKKILKEDIRNSNTDAIVLMARFYETKDHDKYIHWLKKASESGHAPSQYKLATYYKEGNEFFLFEDNRANKVRELYAKSASKAYPPAMRHFAFYNKDTPLETKDSFVSSLLNQGDMATIASLCIEYSYDVGSFKKDILKATSFCQIYIKSISKEKDSSLYNIYNELYTNMYATLKHEQKLDVNDFVENYLKDNTVYDQDNINDYEYTVDPSRLDHSILSLEY